MLAPRCNKTRCVQRQHKQSSLEVQTKHSERAHNINPGSAELRCLQADWWKVRCTSWDSNPRAKTFIHRLCYASSKLSALCFQDLVPLKENEGSVRASSGASHGKLILKIRTSFGFVATDDQVSIHSSETLLGLKRSEQALAMIVAHLQVYSTKRVTSHQSGVCPSSWNSDRVFQMHHTSSRAGHTPWWCHLHW